MNCKNHICVKPLLQTLLSRVEWPFNVFRSPNLCEGSLLLRSCSHPLRFHISSTYQVWGQFDNYLLTSVILIAVAIILLMLYISCYAWVFRVSILRCRVFFHWPSSFFSTQKEMNCPDVEFVKCFTPAKLHFFLNYTKENTQIATLLTNS